MDKKKLTLFDLTSIGVGMVIGAGIFSMLGVGIYFTGKSISIALILAMLVVFLQYINVIYMAGMFGDIPGGSYSQSAVVNPSWMVGTGSGTMLISQLSRSVMGLSIASYLALLFPALANHQKLVAIAVITLAFLVAVKGSKFAAMVQNVMVILMYLALGTFIVFGITKRAPAEVAAEPFFINGTSGFLSAAAMMTFTSSGAAGLASMSDAADQPKKNIPLAIILTTVICAALYALLGFAATKTVSYGAIAGQNLGAIAEFILPKSLYTFFVVGGALFALSTTLLGGISTMIFPLVQASKDGFLPKALSKTDKNGNAYILLIVMYAIGIVPIIFDFSLSDIVSMVLVPSAIISIINAFVTWKLPEKFEKQWKEGLFKNMSGNAYRITRVISIIAAIFVTIYTLNSVSKTVQIGNIVLTALLFGWSATMGKKPEVKANIEARKQMFAAGAEKAAEKV